MICTKCNIDKSIEDFSWKFKDRNIRHKMCKKCFSDNVKKHYQNNIGKYKEKARRNNKIYLDRNKAFIVDYLERHPCVDCGENDIVVLDFDHVSGIKENNISHLVLQAVSVEMILEEISKCEIRCANCHRRKTARERNYYKWKTPVTEVHTLEKC